MYTPEKTPIVTPLSKFEESPVFNYINSLSPIKPVKSVPVNQTFNSLGFTSLPSIFTSPHAIPHKESRFCTTHTNTDPLKAETLSENGNKNEEVGMDAEQLYDNSAEQRFDRGLAMGDGLVMGEGSMESPNEPVKFGIELPQSLKYDCGSPDCDVAPSGVTESTNGAPLVQLVQEDTEMGSSKGMVVSQDIRSHVETGNEVIGCDWDSLMSDADGVSILNSPSCLEALKGLVQKSQEPDAMFCPTIMHQFTRNGIGLATTMMQAGHVPISLGYPEDTPYLTGESCQLSETNMTMTTQTTQEQVAATSMDQCMNSNMNGGLNHQPGACIPFSYEMVSNLHRGMRRRCLDFETLVAQRKSFVGDGSSFSSSSLGNQEPRFRVPGIGLHLNAFTNAKPESLPSGPHQFSLPVSVPFLDSPIFCEEPLHASSERKKVSAEDGALVAEEAECLVSEESNQISPKKKRRKSDSSGDTGSSCKRCNCKKSKCLKLYCECFAAGVYCVEPCSCIDCFNKPIHEQTVLATRKQIESRNPLAFAPKVIRSSDSVPETSVGAQQDEFNKTPASARHKRGCNCKKSSCLKKYCECFQGGVGCTVNCRCEGCKNKFGRKDGLALTALEVQPEEEVETSMKSGLEKSIRKPEIMIIEEQTTFSSVGLCSPLVQVQKRKPPRSLLPIESSSGYYNTISQGYEKLNTIRSQNLQTVREDDELPAILRGNSSPSSGIIKTVGSPNSKRVSPPHCDSRSSPGRRSGRKLILQSIPSFPSLTPQH